MFMVKCCSKCKIKDILKAFTKVTSFEFVKVIQLVIIIPQYGIRTTICPPIWRQMHIESIFLSLAYYNSCVIVSGQTLYGNAK